jgi:hypothetical protein
MKRLKKLSFIVAVLFAQSAIAQEIEDVQFEGTKKVELYKGQDVKAKKKETISDIIGFDSRGFYALKGSLSIFATEPKIQFYDKSYSLIHEEELDTEVDGSNSRIVDIMHWNDKILVFHNYKSSKTKLNTMYVQEVDKKSLTLVPEMQEIATVDYSGKMKMNAGLFGTAISRDSSKLLAYYQLPYDKDEPERFGFHVYDQNLKQIWHEDIALPYAENLFEVADYTLDDNGNVFLTGKLYNEVRRNKLRGEVNYKYVILSYKNGGKDFKEYELNLEDKFITDVRIAALPNGDLACAGFYSDRGTFSIKGSCFLRVNGQTGELMKVSSSEFGIDFITQNMTERQEAKAKKKEEKGKKVELYAYDLDNLIIREDGGVVLVGEQYYVHEVTTTTVGANGVTTTRTTYHYYYNDIIVVNISPEGNIEWTQKIAKRQHSINDGGFYSSYATAVHKDDLFFFFNDDPRNLSYSGSGRVFNMPFKRSVVTMVQVNGKGEMERESLFSMKDSEVMTRPKVCEQISPDKLILFGELKNLHRFTEVTFK